jgi:hypothetical protein
MKIIANVSAPKINICAIFGIMSPNKCLNREETCIFFLKKIKPGRRAVNLSLYILIGSKEEEEVINLLCGCMI